MNKIVAITTIDNPFDPIDNFQEWFMYDLNHNYFTCSKLSRIANLSETMSSFQQSEEITRAIDRLIELDPLDIYKKVEKEEQSDENIEEDNLEDLNNDSGGPQ